MHAQPSTMTSASDKPDALIDAAAMHRSETTSLHQQIADLQAEISCLRAMVADNGARDEKMEQLREANQNLLLATFGAQDLQASAEADNHAKEEFLSMLAHELRNPLAPIVMANALIGKLLAAHPMLPKLHGIIDRQSLHLKRLVEDLLDASRINSGKITLQREPVVLSEIIESAIETSEPVLTSRNQQLHLDMPQEVIMLDGDAIRLAQVFSNLLINAAKFSANDSAIAILIRRQAESVEIIVRDNGVGIEAAFQPFIFDLFKQGPKTLDRAQGGLGIGLSLVRSIVSMHGGSTSVHSAGLGHGSEFTVILPTNAYAVPVDPAITTLATTTCHGRILLIEDNVDSNDTLTSLLTLEGYLVDSALDGHNGMLMACAQPYDIIICDIGLPTMDGYEIIATLRKVLTCLPRFIALSGYNQTQDRRRALDAGFDHFLAKPASVDVLLDLIASTVVAH
ncbi:hybrid sensor histidine kinase/response regulator [Actimicrobium sp. CCI2.3]|uniref:hybrid sensor histidine kinase/response regulator n=1 Tax=Actimicrobium sp. CCI2.3 TaxID=3048616 RepID=UPI002AB5419F|nr:hybrid sensor histidine kinase/response regulator [Actimicrobium sp. CCI2.3]MDY7572770.1 hybrid sensor histidine kinase/response regulator [Actimicrobium sp. CCI2.3]MEB0022290.1 hybrid sensor histidine kinase/response regulator [Actimicrobium sp. CCI2.3]